MEKEKKRNLLGTFIITSIVYIVLGVFMVVYPDKTANGIRIIFGIGMLVYGLINVISFFLNHDTEENLFLELVLGVIGIGLGIFALVPTDLISKIIFYTIGGVLIIDSLVNLKRSFNLKAMGHSRWYFFTVAAIIGMILGILCVVLYHSMREVVIVFIGISLIYEGISSLLTIFFDWRNKKKITRELSRYDDRD